MPDEGREARRSAFAQAHAAHAADLVPLPGPAGLQRFRLPGHGLLLIDTAPGSEFSQFLRLSRHLGGLGVSTPFIAASDEAQGFALVEDFTATSQGHPPFALAVDLLAGLHEAPGAAALHLPSLDEAALTEELRLFLFWYAPAAAPGLQLDYFSAAFMRLWAQALASLSAERTLVLREVSLGQLLLLPGRPGRQACGVPEFAAARLGPGAADLAALLQDPARALPASEAAALLARYLAARPRLDAAAFHRDYLLLAAQRHCRSLGEMLRAWRRDQQEAALARLAPTQTLLRRALDAAGLHELLALLDEAMPGWDSLTPAGRDPAFLEKSGDLA